MSDHQDGVHQYDSGKYSVHGQCCSKWGRIMALESIEWYRVVSKDCHVS